MGCSLFNLFYLGLVKPFDTPDQNRQEILFEFAVAGISYFAMELVHFSDYAETSNNIGNCMVYLLGIIFLPFIAYQLIGMIGGTILRI